MAAVVVSLAMLATGLVIATRGGQAMVSFGLLLIAVGAISTVVNLYLARRTR